MVFPQSSKCIFPSCGGSDNGAEQDRAIDWFAANIPVGMAREDVLLLIGGEIGGYEAPLFLPSLFKVSNGNRPTERGLYIEFSEKGAVSKRPRVFDPPHVQPGQPSHNPLDARYAEMWRSGSTQEQDLALNWFAARIPIGMSKPDIDSLLGQPELAGFHACTYRPGRESGAPRSNRGLVAWYSEGTTGVVGRMCMIRSLD